MFFLDTLNLALQEPGGLGQPVHSRTTPFAGLLQTAMTVLGGIAHEVLIDHGDVWPTLSAMAEKEAIDLLVIGTHGRRGVEKLLLGSTAEEILRLTQRPVLMVGPLCSVAPETELSLRRILHATDFSPEAEPAMQYAYSLAKAYGATLALLHVAEDVWQEPLSTRLRPADFFRERLMEKHWVVEEEGVVPEYYVEFGPRADCILEISDKLRSELIVIGVRGTSRPHVPAHLPGPAAPYWSYEALTSKVEGRQSCWHYLCCPFLARSSLHSRLHAALHAIAT
jgi:nucleotide-binding universal stress UspA family protein